MIRACAMTGLIWFAMLDLVLCVRHFSLLSDFSYDPFYGTANAATPTTSACTSPGADPWGLPGCNSPKQLLTSLGNDLYNGAPQYVIFCGDWLGMNNYVNVSDAVAAVDWMSNLTRTSTSLSTMRSPTVFSVLGESDFNDVNLSTSTASDYLDALAASLVNNSVLEDDEAISFGNCAFYTRNVTTTLCAIAINTDIWATAGPSDPTVQPDPCGQLAFLSDALDAARSTGRLCIIVGHCPPGVDISVPIEEITPNTVMYWNPAYSNAYAAIIWSNRDIITFQLFGHANSFSFIADSVNLGVPAFIVPSISPASGTNPSYLLASLDETTWRITGLQQRYIDPAAGIWKDGLIVDQALGSAIHEGIFSLATLGAQLALDDAMWYNFQAIRGGGLLSRAPACDDSCRQIISCTTQSIDVGTISNCLPKSTLNVALKVIVTVLVCAGSFFCAITIGVVLLRRKTIFF